MAKSDVKLVMVTTSNNNKFYDMRDNGNGTFTVTWGRVGTPGKQNTYDISQWDKKYREKTSKGYTDVTGNTKKVSTYKEVSDAELNQILNAFLESSRQYVSKFTDSGVISDSAATEAQNCINRMAKNMDIPNPTNLTLNSFNADLIKLFEIIPRKIKDVRTAIARDLDERDFIIKKEQSLLDNLVALSKTAPTTGATMTIEEAFGFTLSKCTPAEIDFIKQRLSEDGFTRYKFNRAWKINNPTREAGFEEYLENNHLANDKNNVKFYWHGTGTENVFSIMANGLLIKPANAYHCGSAYGDGIYTAPNADKASGYTSISGSAWRGGSSRVAFMFLNAVIMGKQFDVRDNYETYGGIKIYNLDGDKFSSKDLGYHSVYAHAGGFLKRDEAIVYNQNQVACRYLVEFKI